jgi:fucose permease
MRSKKTKLNILGAIFTVVLVATLLLRGVMEVRAGHASDSYRNAWGLEITWGSLLIVIAITVTVVLLAVIARLIYQWRVKRGY